MSDHGHSLPEHEGPYFSPKKIRIPMLWLEGAINKEIKEIAILSSQVDFPYTLLALLGGDNDPFTFSKNIFNISSKQYAFYTFNKGYGILNKEGGFVYDYFGKKILEVGKNTKRLDSLGKSICQNSYQDFLER